MISNINIIPDYSDLSAYIDYAKNNKLSFEYNDFFAPDVLDDKAMTDSIIDGYLDAYELSGYHATNHSLHGAFLDVTVFSSDNLIRQVSEKRVVQSLDIARRIGARSVIFHTSIIPGFYDKNYIECFVGMSSAFFSKLAYEYSDINICIENMFDDSPRLIVELMQSMERVNNVGICLDYAHAKVFGKNTEASCWLKECKPYIKHLHINDNNLSEDSHLYLGAGAIDYKEFFDFYKNNLSDVPVLIEVNGLDNIKKSMEYIKNIC